MNEPDIRDAEGRVRMHGAAARAERAGTTTQPMPTARDKTGMTAKLRRRSAGDQCTLVIVQEWRGYMTPKTCHSGGGKIRLVGLSNRV